MTNLVVTILHFFKIIIIMTLLPSHQRGFCFMLQAPQKNYNRMPNQLLFETKSDFGTVRGKSVAWFTSNCHTQGHAYQEDITNMDGHSGTSMRAFICVRREKCFEMISMSLSNCIEK